MLTYKCTVNSGAEVVLKLYCKIKLFNLDAHHFRKNYHSVTKIHLKYISKEDYPSLPI